VLAKSIMDRVRFIKEPWVDLVAKIWKYLGVKLRKVQDIRYLPKITG
jgi:hypothetical protein